MQILCTDWRQGVGFSDIKRGKSSVSITQVITLRFDTGSKV